jgi:hypothetical protein
MGQLQGKYEVIYPYDAEREDELVLRPGDVIDVEEQHGNWWRGRKGGFGPMKWLHKDFVALLPERDDKQERQPTGQQVNYQGRAYHVHHEDTFEDAECSICLNLAFNPCQTQCCGHTVCAQCANKWKRQNDSCHHCRKSPFVWSKDIRIQRLISGLTVYCIHYSGGCDWKGSLHMLRQHLNESCPLVFTGCGNDGCTEKVQRRYVSEHMTRKCQQRFTKCPFCNQDNLNYQELISTHYRTCGNWPLRCPQNCSNGDLTRSTLKKHIASECSEVVRRCPLVVFGCKATVKRKDMHQHVRSHHNMAKGSLNAIVSDLDSNWKACTEEATANMSQVLQTTFYDVIPAVRSRSVNQEEVVRDVKEKSATTLNDVLAEFEKKWNMHMRRTMEEIESKSKELLEAAEDDLRKKCDVSLTKAEAALRSGSEVKPEELIKEPENLPSSSPAEKFSLFLAALCFSLVVVYHNPVVIVFILCFIVSRHFY